MIQLHEIYLAAILVSSLIMVGILVYAWPRRHNPGVVQYMLLNVCGLMVSRSFMVLTTTEDPTIGFASVQARFIALLFAPPLALSFVFEFIGRPAWINRWVRAAIWGFPVLTLVVLFTPGLTQHFFAEWSLVRLDGYSVEQRVVGGWYPLYTLYQLSVVGLVIYLMGDHALRVDSSRRYWLVWVAPPVIALVVLTNLPITLGPAPGLRLTPLLLGVLAAGVGWVFWRHNTLSILPVAYDRIIDSVQDSVLVLNPNSSILSANPAAQRLLGRADLLNRPLAEVLPLPPGVPVGNEPAYRFEFTRDGVELEAESLPLAQGARWVGRTLVLRDITARKQAEREAIELAFERERGRILSSFIRDASHEFRTPITVIKTSLHLLNRAADSDKRAKQSDLISLQIDRMTRLIEDLQKMATLDSKPPLNLRRTDLRGLLPTLRYKAEDFARQYGCTLVVRDSVIPIVCEVDEVELEKAILRLVDNAVRFSRAGGTVTLSLSRTEGMAHIHIQDKGVGMDAETLRQSTQRFYRKDDAHSTAGFGLGLPIAKLVVEQHGGQLSLISVPGQGTTATLSLPTAPQTDTAPLSLNDIPPDTQPKRPPGFMDDMGGGKKVPA